MYRKLKAIFFSTYLFLSIIVINIFQTLIFPFKLLFPKSIRKINRFFADTWWGWCHLILKNFQNVEIELSEDVPEQENAIVIANHQGMVDVPVLFSLAYKKKRLGDMKWIVKDVLKYVPGVGWGMIYLDCIFVKRNWFADRKKIENAFSRFKKHQIPLWLMSFPEGTRKTKNKLARSQEFAKKKGYPIFENVLIPRAKGFSASLKGLRDYIDAVYDVTIQYPEKTPSIWELSTKIKKPIKVKVERFPIESIPMQDEDVSKWLLNQYKIKNELMGLHD